MGTIDRKKVHRRRVSLDTARVTDAKRGKGGSKITGKFGKEKKKVSISASHPARKNRSALRSAGSREAQQFDANARRRRNTATEVIAATHPGGRRPSSPVGQLPFATTQAQQAQPVAEGEAPPVVSPQPKTISASTQEQAGTAINARFKQEGGLQGASNEAIIDRYFNIGQEYDAAGNQTFTTEMQIPASTIAKGGLQVFRSMFKQRKLQSEVEKGFSKTRIPSPGTKPPSTDPENVNALVPLNSKTEKLVKDHVNKIIGTKEAVVTTNPMTGKQSVKLITKTGALVAPKTLAKWAGGLAILAISSAIGTAGISLWARWEAAGVLEAGAWAAYESGNFEEAKENLAAAREVKDVDFGEVVRMAVPVEGFVHTLGELKDEFDLVIETWDTVLSDGEAQLAQGQTNAEFWIERDRIRDELERERLDIEYENQELLILHREQARERGDKAELERYEKQLKLKAQYDALRREADLEYWRRYYELAERMRDQAGPSNLNFGLL